MTVTVGALADISQNWLKLLPKLVHLVAQQSAPDNISTILNLSIYHLPQLSPAAYSCLRIWPEQHQHRQVMGTPRTTARRWKTICHTLWITGTDTWRQIICDTFKVWAVRTIACRSSIVQLSDGFLDKTKYRKWLKSTCDINNDTLMFFADFIISFTLDKQNIKYSQHSTLQCCLLISNTIILSVCLGTGFTSMTKLRSSSAVSQGWF